MKKPRSHPPLTIQSLEIVLRPLGYQLLLRFDHVHVTTALGQEYHICRVSDLPSLGWPGFEDALALALALRLRTHEESPPPGTASRKRLLP